MKKSTRDVQKKMTEPENKTTYSSEFYWHDPTNFLFVKYQAKENGASNEKKKTKMILFCNANKLGVDCFDQMAH